MCRGSSLFSGTTLILLATPPHDAALLYAPVTATASSLALLSCFFRPESAAAVSQRTVPQRSQQRGTSHIDWVSHRCVGGPESLTRNYASNGAAVAATSHREALCARVPAAVGCMDEGGSQWQRCEANNNHIELCGRGEGGWVKRFRSSGFGFMLLHLVYFANCNARQYCTIDRGNARDSEREAGKNPTNPCHATEGCGMRLSFACIEFVTHSGVLSISLF